MIAIDKGYGIRELGTLDSYFVRVPYGERNRQDLKTPSRTT